MNAHLQSIMVMDMCVEVFFSFLFFKYHTSISSQGNYFSCLIFCKDKDKNMILFFYHSLLPFGGTDLKMMMMMTKNTKSNYLH